MSAKLRCVLCSSLNRRNKGIDGVQSDGCGSVIQPFPGFLFFPSIARCDWAGLEEISLKPAGFFFVFFLVGQMPSSVKWFLFLECAA